MFPFFRIEIPFSNGIFQTSWGNIETLEHDIEDENYPILGMRSLVVFTILHMFVSLNRFNSSCAVGPNNFWVVGGYKINGNEALPSKKSYVAFSNGNGAPANAATG